MRNVMRLIVSGLACMCFACTINLPVSKELAFSDRPNKLPHAVGLYLSPETRAYVGKGERNGGTYLVPLGESLESNAVRSLGKIFAKVRVIDGLNQKTPEEKAVVVITFKPETAVLPGLTTFSENRVVVHLTCQIYRDASTSVWTDTVSGDLSQDSKWGLMGAMVGNMAYNKAFERAGNASLTIALEELNDTLLKNAAVFGDVKTAPGK